MSWCHAQSVLLCIPVHKFDFCIDCLCFTVVNNKLICEVKSSVCKAFILSIYQAPDPREEPSQVEEQIVQPIETALRDKKQHHEKLTVKCVSGSGELDRYVIKRF